MSEIPASNLPALHPLTSRLTRLRTRVRSIIAARAAGILLTAALISIFLLILADYLLEFPASLRMILLLAWLIALALLAWRFLLAPLSCRLTDQFLASRVENLHQNLSDDLISAVHFIHTQAARSNALAARQIDLAAEKTAAIRFEEAVDFRQAGKSLAVAALACIVVAAVAVLNPALANIGLHRWFTASALPWPRSTHVEFDWTDFGGAQPKKVPAGDTLTLRARVDKGNPSHVWLYSWGDLPSRSEPMQFQSQQSSSNEKFYESSLDPKDGGMIHLRVTAGDDNDEPEVVIGVAPRPEIRELSADITPPPYVKNIKDTSQPAPAVHVDLFSQSARAVEGAAISLRVKSTKPFLAAAGEPDIRLLDQNKGGEIALPFQCRLLEPDLAEISFTASKSLQARLLLHDADGFENRVSGNFNIEVVPDGLPSVVITDPRRSVDRSPAAVVEIAMQATDDLGLEGLKLVAEKFDAKPGDPPVFESPIPWTDRTVDPAAGSTVGRAHYTWNLAPLNLTPGARLLFYAMVQDNYDMNGQRHPWVKSAPLTLQIRSTDDLINQNRHDLNEIRDRIKNLKSQQDQTHSLTEAIRKAVDASNVTTAQQKAQLADLADQQSQQTSSAASIQQRAQDVAENLRQNMLGDADLGKLAQTVAQGMQQVGQENMTRAASDLNNAQQSAGNQNPNNQQQQQDARQTAASAQSASAQQALALTRMDNLINKLGAAGDFEAARSKVANILNKQQQLNKQTAETANAKNPDQQKDQEQKLAAQQAALQDQTNSALQEMKRSAEALAQSDPASATSLQNAAQAGEKGEVAPSQQQASRDLAAGAPNNAGSQQSKATQGLQEMMDELNKNERRQLEQLARQLQDLLKEVQERRAAQVTLNKDTVTAGASAAAAPMEKLGDRQATIHAATLLTEKKAENTRDAQDAAQDIHQATDYMSTAAGTLYAAKQPDSLDPETKALAALDNAIKKLQKAADNAASQLKDKDLAEYIKQYEQIKTGEASVKKQTGDIETTRQASDDKQLDHRGELAVAGLAKQQGDLKTKVDGLSADDKLKAFDVVIWMNGQVTESMSASQDRLNKAQTGTQVASAQQTSIDRLQMIIDALKEEQKRESDFRNENNGGGGGGGAGGHRAPRPPLAQLKMLKAMQVVVNGQTQADNNALKTAAQDDEKQQYQDQVEQLGKKQGEIQSIADKLMQQLQH